MDHDGQELSHLNGDNLTPDHRNLLALPWEEKAALAPSFEGQLVPLANQIVQLRRRPEFTAINQIADRLLRPAQSNSLPEQEVVALFR